MKTLEKAIVNTLQYHGLFEYPLERDEIWKYLIFKLPITNYQFSIKHSISNDQFTNELKKLRENKRVGYKRGYYFLTGKEKTVGLRLKREKFSKKKIKIAKKVAKILGKTPWVKMIGISGALAMNNCDEDDDIDLMVITAENKLWTTRFLCVVILELLGVRRRPSDRGFRDKVCLNMLIDETALELGREKPASAKGFGEARRNLYTAHEIAQMKMIFDRDNTYKRFLIANKWVRKYLPNAIKTKNLIRQLADKSQKNRRACCDFIENFIYQLQRKYMSAKITNEQIGKHFAFFHPKNRGKTIINKYNSVLQ
jgi:predicted nucleotidyltransferase